MIGTRFDNKPVAHVRRQRRLFSVRLQPFLSHQAFDFGPEPGFAATGGVKEGVGFFLGQVRRLYEQGPQSQVMLLIHRFYKRLRDAESIQSPIKAGLRPAAALARPAQRQARFNVLGDSPTTFAVSSMLNPV